MASEQNIQKQISNYLESVGAYTFKVIEANRSGVADICACLNGSYIAIEVKKPGGVISAIQKVHIDLVRAAGGSAFVVYSLDEAKEHIDNLLGIEVEFEV